MRIASSSDGLNMWYQCAWCLSMPWRNSARVITWWVHDNICINLEGSANAMQGVPVLHWCKSYQPIVNLEPNEAADESLLIEMKSVLCGCCHQQFMDRNDVAPDLQSSQSRNWYTHRTYVKTTMKLMWQGLYIVSYFASCKVFAESMFSQRVIVFDYQASMFCIM